MGNIAVDKSGFVARFRGEPDSKAICLWIFTIAENDVCFYGKYPEAVTTAKLYAHRNGLDSGTIRLVDYANALAGLTRH